VGITFVGQITCSAISFSVALLISTKNIFGLCPGFNLEAFERQQLYEIWRDMGSIIIYPCVYNPIYSSSNSSCSKVHLNIDVIMYGSFGPPFLSMKSISSSQCLTSVYEAWSCLGARTISLPFDTQLITTMNVVVGYWGRLLLAILLACLPKSVTGCLLHLLPFFLASRISLAHLFKNISTHCRRIHSSIIEIIQGQPDLECLQKMCNCRLPVQGFISNLLEAVLPPDYGPMLLLQEPSHPYFLPLVERTIVGLPHPFGKFLQGEFSLLQADWRYAICTAQVQRIVALIICIILVVGQLRQWGQFCNPCDICCPRFHGRLESFRWEANPESPKCAGRWFKWKIIAGRCWLINGMVFRRSWRYSRCTWR